MSSLYKVGIIGLGFVGGSILKSFEIKKINVTGYDKFKDGGINTFDDVKDANVVFLALPTLYSEELQEYDKSALHEICAELRDAAFKGIVVIKSTVEPGTTEIFAKLYNLSLVHNPEFLTARTAFIDFHNQSHIVLGKTSVSTDAQIDQLEAFYRVHWTDAEYSRGTSTETETMKIACNTFYAVKVQFFNELYFIAQKDGSDYVTVRNMMLKNKWINPMHTDVPGPDGQFSYGGACLPKDSSALMHHMRRNQSINGVVKGCVEERNEMRKDENGDKKE